MNTGMWDGKSPIYQGVLNGDLVMSRWPLRLLDGSNLTMSPDAQLLLNWGPGMRHFTLNCGEVMFYVNYYPNHSFSVDAGCVRVCAMEGGFRVALSSDGLVLTVHAHESRVTVLIDPDAESGTIDESRAERVTLEACRLAEFHIGGDWTRINPEICPPRKLESAETVEG